MKATWNNIVLAESEETILIEGNHYFPPSSVNFEHLAETDSTSECHWKGTANYYSAKVGGETNTDCAWVYRNPKDKAGPIKDHIAFWKGVVVER